MFSLVYFDATKQRGPPSFVWYPPMRAQKPIDSSRVRQPVKAPLKPVSQEGRRGGSAATVLGFLHRRKRLKHLRRRATFSRGPSEPRQPTTFAPGAKRSPREEVTKESKKEPPLGIGGKKKNLLRWRERKFDGGITGDDAGPAAVTLAPRAASTGRPRGLFFTGTVWH